jgi:sialate O-acetylesterase
MNFSLSVSKPKRPIAILLIAGLAFAGTIGAKVTLPSVLANNMVLQQQTKVNLWGKATAKKTVKIRTSWNGKYYKTVAGNDGKWQIKVDTPAAGGPYSIEFNDGTITKLDNILVGEVWMCSGQSNMEMPMTGFDRQPLEGSNTVIAQSKPSTSIRMFITDSKDGKWVRQQNLVPQDDMQGEWLMDSPEGVAPTSATAYFFAKFLQNVLDVPVGIMVSSVGGSKIEAWMSREAIEPFKNEVDMHALVDKNKKVDACITPTVLFNGKMNPLVHFTIKGFIWYQGESNRGASELYSRLMPAFVKDLRSRWGEGDLPFYYVQIAPFDYEGADKFSGALLREAQEKCLERIPNSGMVSTIDIGNHNFIHPVRKEPVGTRLALLALGKTYGKKGFGYESPSFVSQEIKDGKIYINVKNADHGLCPMWTSLKGFEIAGEDGVFHEAFAEIETQSCRLAVSSKDVPNPKYVRYGFRNTPVAASVFNTWGLPLLPFRTDTFNVGK